MMQMLQAGGMGLLTDGRRPPDEHNPRGYYEHEAVKHSREDVTWLANAGGKAVKVVHLLLDRLPMDRDYRVIFMRRDLQEVIRSQRAMLGQQRRPAAALSDDALAEVFRKQLAGVRQWLETQRCVRVLELDYRDVIANPRNAAGQVNDFLGGTLAIDAMAAAVEPALYRQRKTGAPGT